MPPILDSHMHLLPAEPGREVVVEEILGQMAACDIVCGIVAHGLPSARLDEIVAAHGTVLKGLIHVRGNALEQSFEEIDRYGDNPNIVGIKIYPNSFAGSDFLSARSAIRERIGTRRWLVQIHTNPVIDTDLAIPLRAVQFADETDLPVVAVHVGGHQFLQFAGWLDHGIPENLYFETSAVQNMLAGGPYAAHLKWLLDRVPSDRLLWGSDYPEYSFRSALAAFQGLGFIETRLAQIAWSNPMKLLRDHTGTPLPPGDPRWLRREPEWGHEFVFQSVVAMPGDADAFTFYWSAPEVSDAGTEVEWAFVLPDGSECLMVGCSANPPGQSFRSDVDDDHMLGDPRCYRGREVAVRFRARHGRMRFPNRKCEFVFRRRRDDGAIDWLERDDIADAVLLPGAGR